MKINTAFMLNSSVTKLVTHLILLLCVLVSVAAECNLDYGCLGREKFKSMVTVQKKDGTPEPLRTIFEYKMLYIFTDRIVFYASRSKDSPTLEPDDSRPSMEKIENDIERVIYFGDIMLDCGKYKNKLCHAQEYPNIEKNESFLKIKAEIDSNADAYCLVIPYFENGYKKQHDKMAYLCAIDSKELYKIITFKNFLSRKIELYQQRMSNDRFNGFNGLLKKKGKFITVIDGRQVPVIGYIYNRGMILRTNNEERKFLQYYSFYQQRQHRYFAYVASKGLARNKIPKNWDDGFDPRPNPDCCIYFKGEVDNNKICLATDDGESMESASDICKMKMRIYYGEVLISLRGIKFAEAYTELKSNSIKRKNCKSQEYQLMKFRAEKTMLYAVENDCKFVMDYINNDDYNNKYEFCFTDYRDELKLELNLMSLDNEEMYEAINDCVYKLPEFEEALEQTYFDKMIQKAGLTQQKSSFLQISSDKESNDYDDDDEEVAMPKNPVLKQAANPGQMRFSEIKSTGQGNHSGQKPKKKRSIIDYVYSKPKKLADSDKERALIFRNTKMTELQKTHRWEPAPRESIDERFVKPLSSLGKKNTDEFVTFLGYLRDASFRASKLKSASEEKKLQSLSKI